MNHTPGPWRWVFNRQHKSITLVGGRPMFDKTVMQFDRWGMGGATPLFNSEIAGNKYNIMERVCDMPDWVKPFPGRAHHADWCQQVVHPDALLIQAAPVLYSALISIATSCEIDTLSAAIECARNAIRGIP